MTQKPSNDIDGQQLIIWKMNASWTDTTIHWIGQHPLLAGAAAFTIAFCDALILVGTLVPALPLLFAVGMLIGLGQLSGPYLVSCTAMGAFVGDAISFWVGHNWGDRLRQLGPFQRYPQLLERGERLFRRNAIKGIILARYIGAIRPFVPAVAGMLGMPTKQYLLTSVLVCLSWAVVFLLPGWMFGQAYEAVAAVAGHLCMLIAVAVGVMAIIWTVTLHGWRLSARLLDRWLAHNLARAPAGRQLRRLTWPCFELQQRNAIPAAVMAILLVTLGLGWFILWIILLTHPTPLAMDQITQQWMLSLRNPLLDPPMAIVALLGSWHMILPSTLVPMLYLAWRQRWVPLWYWFTALTLGTGVTWLLATALTDTHLLSAHHGGCGPATVITALTLLFGFFAILTARELPGRHRVWPYLIAGYCVSFVTISRLYFGLNTLSDALEGALLGWYWLFITGFAYRRQVRPGFWVTPLAWSFYGTFVLSAIVVIPKSLPTQLQQWAPASPIARVFAPARWWQGDWRQVPVFNQAVNHEPIDFQFAGSLPALQAHFTAGGWSAQKSTAWTDLLQCLDSKQPEKIPVFPKTLNAKAESLLLVRTVDGHRRLVIRLWPSGAVLAQTGSPIWVGQAQTLHLHRVGPFFALWLPEQDDRAASAAMTVALPPLTTKRVVVEPQQRPLVLITNETQILSQSLP